MTAALPDTMEEAVQRLQLEAHKAKPGQDFTVRRFEPGDAWAVARCFYEVYEEHYPFDTYYVPEKLIEANQKGDMIGVVAATETGDIIAFGALFRNFAHNRKLYETGQATVIPEYRGTLAVLCIQEYLFTNIADGVEVDAILGEPVCSHLTMQKIASIFGFCDTGIELCLMPGETYNKGDGSGGRISTGLSFKVLRDHPCELFLPVEYGAVLGAVLQRLPISRTPVVSTALPSPGSVSDLDVRSFEQMQAMRVSVLGVGEDFPSRLDEVEAQARGLGVIVLQFFVNLGDPCCGMAVRSLRERGFFLGGFLPQWFGTDGLLLQQLGVEPDYASVQLLTDESKALLEAIRKDRDSLPSKPA